MFTHARPMAFAAMASLLWFGGGGCTADGFGSTGKHPLATHQIWTQYRALEDRRALAIAGDPSRVWVAGMAGGLPTAVDAQREALSACAKQRARRRMQSQCLIYADGMKVVWR